MDSVWNTGTTPEPGEMVLVTCETETGIKSVNRAYIDESGVWHGSDSMSNVTAWQPLPKPYKRTYMVLDEQGFSIKHPGQRILDTHVGSGSSLIACHRFRCPFVGFEIDPDYYAKAKARLDAEQAQYSIFDYLNDRER